DGPVRRHYRGRYPPSTGKASGMVRPPASRLLAYGDGVGAPADGTAAALAAGAAAGEPRGVLPSGNSPHLHPLRARVARARRPTRGAWAARRSWPPLGGGDHHLLRLLERRAHRGPMAGHRRRPLCDRRLAARLARALPAVAATLAAVRSDRP